jgi:LmbE family N-acetylglucosaminyl deacetylase
VTVEGLKAMSTLVFFHAHPDDEAIATGGVMAKAAAEGHRVVLVTATRGERGEVDDGVLRPGEELWERRVEDLAEAVKILGVARQEYLGYVDSGMMGTADNDTPGSFWTADVEEAAVRLATILRDEQADVLTVYDDHGNYGHPDHIQVHRVGVRAAALAGTARVFEATVNRDAIRAHIAEAMKSGEVPSEQLDEMVDQGLNDMGSPAEIINTEVDVRPWIQAKRDALFVHASQVSEESWFAKMSDDAFLRGFGQEWFILRDPPAGWPGTDLLEGLG